jgi:hypothetical protein
MDSGSSKVFSIGDRIKQYYVTPRYGHSLQKIISVGHHITENDISLLGLTLINALEHMHQQGVVLNNLTLDHVIIGNHNF